MSALIVPVLLCSAGIFALSKRVNVFSALTDGASEGLKISAGMLPALVVLLSGVYMLRASGALDALCGLLTPLLEYMGIPGETASLLLIRPFSGSGALAAGSEIMRQFGPDSYAGRCAAGVKKTRHAIPAALTADLCGFIMAALTVRLFFG